MKRRTIGSLSLRAALFPVIAACSVAGCAQDVSGDGSQSTAQGVSSSRATLPGSVPPWANAGSRTSATSGTDPIDFRVYLGWSDPAGARALAAAVSDPKSASYRQYLTPQQFRQRFAPSAANVAAVQQWLVSQGFSVTYTPMNGHYVAAEGTVSQAAAAFATSFANYSVNGKALRAPTSAPSVPSSLGAVVSAVVGLDQTWALVHTNLASDPDAPPAGAFVTPEPCSAYWGEQTATDFPNPYGSGALPYTPCGYSPAQVRSAYGVPSTATGAGQTVAIIDAYASPTIQADLDAWSAARGLPSTKITQVVAPGNYRHPEADPGDPQGWYGEETLDVEAVHGMAPGASIVFVGAANAQQDLDAAMNHVVDRGLAQIVSNSYGWSSEQVAAGFVIPFEDTMLQAAIEGIGVYFSSGDDSDESQTVGYVTADWPATSPYVTAVGGTSLAVGASNQYLFETGWGTSRSAWDASTSSWSPAPPGTWVYGAGGGVSTLFAEPSYQAGVVDSFLASYGRSGRAVPDVSAFADPNTGYLIGQTQTFPDGTVKYSEYRIGGTSLSCPIFAGLMALADQAAGAPHGFANPALYALDASAFRDVTSPKHTVATVRADYLDGVSASSGMHYTLRTFNSTLSLRTTAGYDDVTGRGSPAPGFVAALSK